MGMRYVTQFTAVAVSAVQDFFEIVVPADACVVIHEIHITQSSDAGDSESEQIRVQLKRGVGSTSGAGGGTDTPSKLETGFSAAGSTVEINNTTPAVAGGGSLDTLLEEDFNIHVGWHYVPVPESRFQFSPGEEIYVSLPAAPSDALTMSGYCIFEEIGG